MSLGLMMWSGCDMSFDVMSELVPVVNYPTHSAPSIKGGLFAALSLDFVL
jgi:hypothetical protein